MVKFFQTFSAFSGLVHRIVGIALQVGPPPSRPGGFLSEIHAGAGEAELRILPWPPAVCIVHSPEGFRLLIFCLFKSEGTP